MTNCMFYFLEMSKVKGFFPITHLCSISIGFRDYTTLQLKYLACIDFLESVFLIECFDECKEASAFKNLSAYFLRLSFERDRWQSRIVFNHSELGCSIQVVRVSHCVI